MRYVIVGGTGTMGKALTKALLTKKDTERVLIVSRGELKQKELRDANPGEYARGRLRFVIGDVRDKDAMYEAIDPGVSAVFLCAALKHVDVAEDNPLEALKTNALGVANVAEAAMTADVPHVVFSSTDKACLPVNAYGMSKAWAERYLWAMNRRQVATRFAVYRWGNVLGSRGSVIHDFIRTLETSRSVSVTDPRMTRFWLKIEEAVAFMLSTYRDAAPDRPMIPKMRASSVMELAEATARLMKMTDFEVKVVGIRNGEKLHETIESTHEKCLRSDTAERFSKEDLEALIAPLIEGCA